MGFFSGLINSAFGSHQAGNQTSTVQQQLSPGMQQLLYGADGGSGMLPYFASLLQKPQSDASKASASDSADYLKTYGGQDLGAIHGAATGLMGGNAAPQITPASASLPAYAGGAVINAPAQNNIDLTGTLRGLMSGGDNAALKSSLAYGTALTGAQFDKNQADLTNNLLRNVLPSIQGGAIAAGQYGGTRQGIAQGNALSDFTHQLNDSNTQMGLASSANTSGALAGDYEQGQNRALSAAQALSAQQYATAMQQAQFQNQAELTNVGNLYDASKTNAGFQQQGALANQSATLQTNAQNNGAALSGSGLLDGLLGRASGTTNAQDNYDLTRAQGVSSMIAPYSSLGQTTTSTQPLYQNTGANLLGGLLGGLGIANGIKKLSS